jgi:DNA modification methylase
MSWRVIEGDCREVLRTLPEQSVQTCITSPPYFGLRDYGHDGQIGLETTPDEFVSAMVGVFREVRRVLKDDGTVWLNLGDSYSTGGMSNPSPSLTLGGGKDRGAKNYSITRKTPIGLKHKDLIGIPWRVAFALQADGWYLRQDIIWHKPNPMPESVRDRCTKAHEYIFLLSKSPRYYYDAEAIKEEAVGTGGGAFGKVTKEDEAIKSKAQVRRYERPDYKLIGRNKRSVWTVCPKPFREAHFATYPPDLIEPCVLAGCPEGGTVLDPFNGAGTTGVVCVKRGRDYTGIELNPEYAEMARKRIAGEQDNYALYHQEDEER